MLPSTAVCVVELSTNLREVSQGPEKAPTRAFSLISLSSPALTWLVAGGGAEMERIYTWQHHAAMQYLLNIYALVREKISNKLHRQYNVTFILNCIGAYLLVRQ